MQSDRENTGNMKMHFEWEPDRSMDTAGHGSFNIRVLTKVLNCLKRSRVHFCIYEALKSLNLLFEVLDMAVWKVIAY